MKPYPPSFWETNRSLGTFDLVIIGAGMVGLWSAWHAHLKHPNLSILVLDQLPSGQSSASTRNAGFACYGSPSEILSDLQAESSTDVINRMAMRYAGLQEWLKVFDSSTLGWTEGPGYEVFDLRQKDKWVHTCDHLGVLNKMAQGAGISDLAYRIVSPPTSNMVGCIAIEHEAGFHPGRAHHALKTALNAKGIHFMHGVIVPQKSEWIQSSNTWILPTPLGQITAQHIIVATNAWTQQLFPGLDVQPGRGQVLLTAPIDQLPYEGTYHADEGYLYFRNLGTQLLLGGGRNAYQQEETTWSTDCSPHIQDYLEHYLHQVLLPGKNPKIVDRWAGTMAFSNHGNKQPIFIQERSLTIVARMSGMGLALSPELGKRAVDLL